MEAALVGRQAVEYHLQASCTRYVASRHVVVYQIQRGLYHKQQKLATSICLVCVNK